MHIYTKYNLLAGISSTTETPTTPSVDISVLNELVGADDVDVGYDKDGFLALWAFKGKSCHF